MSTIENQKIECGSSKNLQKHDMYVLYVIYNAEFSEVTQYERLFY